MVCCEKYPPRKPTLLYTRIASFFLYHTFLKAGAILLVSVPATIIQSAWRGLARNTTPKRSMSYRGAAICIISTAQQASPNVIGHSELYMNKKTQFYSTF